MFSHGSGDIAAFCKRRFAACNKNNVGTDRCVAYALTGRSLDDASRAVAHHGATDLFTGRYPITDNASATCQHICDKDRAHMTVSPAIQPPEILIQIEFAGFHTPTSVPCVPDFPRHCTDFKSACL